MAESNFVETKSEPNKVVTGFKVFRQIWKEMTLGVGFWGALRPIVAALIEAIPFLFLGQHFNRKHQKGLDYALLQIPLALTVVLWFVLWAFSIFDAWRDATKFVANKDLQGSHI